MDFIGHAPSASRGGSNRLPGTDRTRTSEPFHSVRGGVVMMMDEALRRDLAKLDFARWCLQRKRTQWRAHKVGVCVLCVCFVCVLLREKRTSSAHLTSQLTAHVQADFQLHHANPPHSHSLLLATEKYKPKIISWWALHHLHCDMG